MKVKQGKVMPAMSAIDSIGKQSMKSATAYKLFMLKKALTPIIEFRVDQESKIIYELGGDLINVRRSVHFDDADQGAEYVQRCAELNDIECDINIEKQTISLDTIPEITIADIYALDEFIEWVE